MESIANHLNSALGIVKSAQERLGSQVNSDDGGGFGNWLKDQVQTGTDFVGDRVQDGLGLANDIKDEISDIDVKGIVSDTVTTTAEIAASGYEKLADLAEDHPRVASLLEGGSNFFIDELANVAELGIDKNPETLDWEDLGAIWLLEVDDVGTDGVIVFDENSRTTQDLMGQEGVEDTRNVVMDAILNGGETEGSEPWTYGVDGYYESLQERNKATIFLGSYTTQYSITENADGTYTVDYTVNNTSGLESGTRFRVDNDGNGVHDGIIPNKDVGDGLHLGGTVSQRWEWSETITQEELENFQN